MCQCTLLWTNQPSCTALVVSLVYANLGECLCANEWTASHTARACVHMVGLRKHALLLLHPADSSPSRKMFRANPKLGNLYDLVSRLPREARRIEAAEGF